MLLLIETVNPEDVKGKELFPELYANIFMLAKKKSGKTVTVGTILKKCAGRAINGEKTCIIIFASTIHKDAMWAAIIKMLQKRNYEVTVHTSINEDRINQSP